MNSHLPLSDESLAGRPPSRQVRRPAGCVFILSHIIRSIWILKVAGGFNPLQIICLSGLFVFLASSVQLSPVSSVRYLRSAVHNCCKIFHFNRHIPPSGPIDPPIVCCSLVLSASPLSSSGFPGSLAWSTQLPSSCQWLPELTGWLLGLPCIHTPWCVVPSIWSSQLLICPVVCRQAP